jgi:small-conductance mechanosensitive channel
VAVHADFVASRVGDALRAERRRSALARSVFSTSLLVFSALVVFLALGKLSGAIARSRQWVASRPSGLPAVRIAGIDVVRPVALRGVALGAIDASRWVFGIGLVYVWLLFALSLFETTRPYSERLTGIVLAPLYGFLGRLTATMPVLFLAAVGGLVLLITLRVIALFFEGVTRGEPALSWLPPDLASPTSILVRIGLILVAASAATPLLTGNEEGPLARASLVAMAALALALSPILATAVVGITVLFGRQLKVGDFVELGERAGVVRGLGLLAVTLEDAQGCTVRVPHLGGLLYPTKVKGPMPPVAVEIGVLSKHDITDVLELLSKVAAGVGIRGRVEVARIGGTETLYRLTVLSASATVRSELLTAAAKALREADIQLGQSSPSLGRR